ncbi:MULTISPECIES: hypothetical protein [Cupriavidus]|nr:MULTISPECIES: hypothetical protein [Cupriavidus]MDR3382636.1 hypothetical protein [Cupriavidus basilensis]
MPARSLAELGGLNLMAAAASLKGAIISVEQAAEIVGQAGIRVG